MISQHLFQRGKRGTWHVRIAVPRQRQTLGGPRERIKSLGTTDRQLAERRALPIIAAWRDEWDAGDRENTPATPAITKHTPSVAEIEQAAVEWGYDQYTDFIARICEAIRDAITACPYGDGTNRETWLVGFMVEARRASAP